MSLGSRPMALHGGCSSFLEPQTNLFQLDNVTALSSAFLHRVSMALLLMSKPSSMLTIGFTLWEGDRQTLIHHCGKHTCTEMQIHTRKSTHMCTHEWTHTFMLIYVRKSTHTCVHINGYTHSCKYTHIAAHTCVHVNRCTHTHWDGEWRVYLSRGVRNESQRADWTTGEEEGEEGGSPAGFPEGQGV